MSISPGPGVGGPGIVEPVSLYLERTTRTTQLGSHLLKKSLERRFLDSHQPASDLVPRIMLTAETSDLISYWESAFREYFISSEYLCFGSLALLS